VCVLFGLRWMLWYGGLVECGSTGAVAVLVTVAAWVSTQQVLPRSAAGCLGLIWGLLTFVERKCRVEC
jgi:hypothetical protein